tara:strand:+ start:4443 stop:4823 length:381 start_codon:yes stop_codon:yes gene_type:complete
MGKVIEPTSSEYITINVEPKHIKEGSPGEADCCAISLALLDSNLIEDKERASVRVGGSCDMYKEWIIDTSPWSRDENPLRVHPNDLQEVTNFIDWFDEQCDYDFLSEASEEALNNHTLTFRVKELF